MHNVVAIASACSRKSFAGSNARRPYLSSSVKNPGITVVYRMGITDPVPKRSRKATGDAMWRGSLGIVERVLTIRRGPELETALSTRAGLAPVTLAAAGIVMLWVATLLRSSSKCLRPDPLWVPSDLPALPDISRHDATMSPHRRRCGGGVWAPLRGAAAINNISTPTKSWRWWISVPLTRRP